MKILSYLLLHEFHSVLDFLSGCFESFEAKCWAYLDDTPYDIEDEVFLMFG